MPTAHTAAAGTAAALSGYDREFHVRDDHVKRLVQAVGKQLVVLRLGNSDTGDGSSLTDAAVLATVECCPSLEELELASCIGVTEKAFAAILKGLPGLKELHLTGHDRVQGAPGGPRSRARARAR